MRHEELKVGPGYLSTNKVDVDLNVFRPLILNQIVRNVYCPDVVTLDCSNFQKRGMKLPIEITNPTCL